MALDIDKSDVVTVAESIYPLLTIGVGEFVELRFGQLLINVNDNVGLSKLMAVGDDIAVDGNTCSVSIVNVTSVQIDRHSDVVVPDDGHGVSLSGGVGSAVVIVAIDNVGLSKLINVGEAVTVSEPAPTISFVNPGGAITINLAEPTITVTEQVWLGPFDYVFVTESVAVYFRTLCVTGAPDVVAVTDPGPTVLITGGSPTATIQIFRDDVVTVEAPDAIPGIPLMPNKFDVASLLPTFAQVGLPLMPNKFEVITIDDTLPVLRVATIVISKGDDVTAGEDRTLRFSRLFISIAEDVSAVEIAGIGRPSTTWEAGAESSATWNGSSSTSDDWEPGAVEETVWA